ncbi:MAG: hypothetical protein H6738_17170 [Alphaproteobacteria bacterium]|nr:hypothetical protein [Alphaproteobacteria bacterium]MCB9698516.1 hypothetical protein [Alphaproteobacteria bacterium]
MRIEAPGKVVLLGEYAVLDGAPALVAAVDRGVSCEVLPSETLSWRTPGDDRFVSAALVGAPPATYVFADWNPVASDDKPGLGGSAAATVAAVAAAARVRGEALSAAELFERAVAVHRAVQGSGSGIDVAASAHGGVLRFQGGVARPIAPVTPAVVYTGRSASTGPRVQRYLALPDRRAFVDRSAELVAWFEERPVEATREAASLLRSMSEQAGIDYWTDAIDALARLAERHGGAAKPSGAGGGDVVVGFFEDPAERAAFERHAASLGLLPIPVRIARGAVTCFAQQKQEGNTSG